MKELLTSMYCTAECDIEKDGYGTDTGGFTTHDQPIWGKSLVETYIPLQVTPTYAVDRDTTTIAGFPVEVDEDQDTGTIKVKFVDQLKVTAFEDTGSSIQFANSSDIGFWHRNVEPVVLHSQEEIDALAESFAEVVPAEEHKEAITEGKCTNLTTCGRCMSVRMWYSDDMFADVPECTECGESVVLVTQWDFS